MRRIIKFSARIVAALAALLCVETLRAQQPSGQWDFNNGDLSATVGAPLLYVDGPGGATQLGTQFGTTTSFAIPDIAGAAAQVMKFPSNSVSMGYSMPTPAAGNGGGSLVNQWTLIMDLLFTGQSHSSWRALLQTDPDGSINVDAEFFINPANGIGIAGAYEGVVKSNTWHRIALVVDQSDGGPNQIRKYIDGVEVGVQRAGGLDGRWGLAAGATATLFTDDNGEANGGYVNSIQLRAEALSKSQIVAFAGPTAAGIPSALPAIPSFVEKWIPPGDFASRDTAIGAVIDPGSTTIQDSSISLQLDGQPVASPSITRAGGLITVNKSNPGPFVSGTKHTIIVALTDSLAGQKTFTHTFEAALFFEDFESLALGANRDEVGLPNPEDNLHVWTNRPPQGWSIDNSKFPATIISPENPDDDGDGFPDQDGRTEWAGWSFAKKEFWLTADDQRRSEFSLATGTVAIADPDEWDDSAHFKSLFNSLLITPQISLAGVSANGAFLRFSSSWRPEALDDVTADPDSTTGFPGDYSDPASPKPTNNQTALITVKYDNNAEVQVLKWDSIDGSPTRHPDSVNESVLVPLNNPAGAQNMVITFAMLYSANDWWWAIDNVFVSAGATPPAITQQPANVEVNEGQPVSLTVVGSGDSYQWFKGQGTGKTAIAGATSATYSLTAAKVEDAGYYSVEVKNSVGSATSDLAKVTILPNTSGRLVLLDENFNSVPLGPPVEEALAGTTVWTKTGPAGWSIDDTGVPGVGTDQDGRTEWAGWSFADRAWWAQTAGDQQRTLFTKGTGASAIADSDTWDDGGPAAGNMATYLKTKPISLQDVKAQSVILKYDSSWRPENPQKATVTVSFDGGAPVEVLRYDSDPNNPNYRPDEVNETISLKIANPAGATNMVIVFGYFETRNNWWWAIDNILVLGDSATQPPPLGVTLTSITSLGNAVSLSWSGGTAPYLVQMKASLSDTNWFNVLTTSAQSATVAKVGSAAFFRVVDQATNVVIPLAAQLNGAGEVPAVTTEGSGMGMFSLEGDTLTYRISFGGLSGNATASHIHGPAEVTGTAPVIIPFTVSPAPSGIISGSVTVTPDQKTNLLSGKTYANIHTAAHTGGEIRGQVNLAQFTATMNGSGEVPVVTTPATGNGTFALIGNQLFYNISFTGLSGNATAAHIHGPADISGTAPVIIPFTVSASTSGTISGTVTVTDQLANLVSGKTYANIHTAAHTGGEIRGQITP